MELGSIVSPHLFYTYLAVLSVIGAGAMAVDKGAAMVQFERISERSLAVIALAGGFAGVIFGGLVFHHKTSKPDFWVPVGLGTIIWGAVLVVYFFPSFLVF